MDTIRVKGRGGLVLLTLALCLAVPSMPVLAQQPSKVRIGYLNSSSYVHPAFGDLFLSRVSIAGGLWGGNLELLTRSAAGGDDRLPSLAAELVGAQVDIIIAASTLGVTLQSLELRRAGDLVSRLDNAVSERAGALLLLDDSLTLSLAVDITTEVDKRRLPAIYGWERYMNVEKRGLMVYGPSVWDLAGTAAKYVGQSA